MTMRHYFCGTIWIKFNRFSWHWKLYADFCNLKISRILFIILNCSFFIFNFSVVSTSTPQNDAELQLYRVLQRASLLAYYDTLLEMGMMAKIFSIHLLNSIMALEILKWTFRWRRRSTIMWCGWRWISGNNGSGWNGIKTTTRSAISESPSRMGEQSVCIQTANVELRWF